MSRTKRIQSSFGAIIATLVLSFSLTPVAHAETRFQEVGAGLGGYRTSVDINNHNQVLVQAITPTPSEFCQFCYKTQHFITDGVTTSEIAIPNQTANKYATALNNNGGISGLTFLGPGDPFYDQDNNWHSKGFIWSNGQFTEYLAPEGFASVSINDINDSNVGAGTLREASLSVTSTISAATFENGTTHLLPHLSSRASSTADAINNNGTVAGTSRAEDGRLHAVIWENGVIRDLGVIGTNMQVLDINNSGKVIGTVGVRISSSSFAIDHKAFTWENNTINYLSSPDGSNSLMPFKVNNNGTVIGDFNGSDGIPRDIMWDPSGNFSIINYPIGAEYTVDARAINDNGVIAGQYRGPVIDPMDSGLTAKAFMFGDLPPIVTEQPKPATKNDCMNNGWKTYGFKNQGLCVSSIVKK